MILIPTNDIPQDVLIDQVVSLANRPREIVRMAAIGYTNHEIANELNVSYSSVCRLLNSKEGVALRKELSDARDKECVDILEDISNMAPIALDVIREALTDKAIDFKIRSAVAKDILDRAGYSPVKKIEKKSVSIIAHTDILERLKKNAGIK